MVDVTSQMSVQTAATAKPSARRYYVLGLLTIIYALNFLDRTIFNVLIEPIKREFQLSDMAMGLLAGFGFVPFYLALGMFRRSHQQAQHRRNRVRFLERHDGALRHGAERHGACAGAD